jgi:F1F0 ATPase subunit 2
MTGLWIALAGAAGIGIGLLHFGGLWWTVRRIDQQKNPAFLLLASQLLRTGLTVALLYLVAGGSWERLLAAVAGLLLARRVLAKRLGPVSPAPVERTIPAETAAAGATPSGTTRAGTARAETTPARNGET